MKKLIIMAVLAIAAACGRNSESTVQGDFRIPEPESSIEGTGKVIPQNDIINVISEVSGRVTAIEKWNGSHVKKGEIIARLEATDVQQDVASAKNRCATQKARIKEAETLCLKSEQEYENARNEAGKARRLFEKGAEIENNVITLENDCEIKRLSAEEKKNALSTARCLLSEYDDELKVARLTLEKYTITAPCDGKILEIDTGTGDMVRPYDAVATVAPDEPRVVLAEIDEIFASMLKIGQKATIFPIGYRNEIATGTIYEMTDLLSEKSIFSGTNAERQDRRVRKIKILLDDQKNTPLIGKKVTCKIHLK